MIVGQGPIVLAVGAGGGLFGHFYSALSFLFSSPSLWETARYRLKYCLKGPLNPKQPTNQPFLNNLKDLDLSYKTDLNFGIVLEGKQLRLITEEIWYLYDH